MSDWDEDSDRLRENLKEAYRLSRDAARQRATPSVGLVRQWHSTTMRGLDVPDDRYIATFRGEPGLEGCEVSIGGRNGTPAVLVSAELEQFENTLQKAVEVLDGLIPVGEGPENADQLNAIIEICAWAHAEWVRIHPFANGNGRTARIWTGFIAMRYGLPPFVRLRPRPDGGYGTACALAMDGDWASTAELFRRMYLEAIRSA